MREEAVAVEVAIQNLLKAMKNRIHFNRHEAIFEQALAASQIIVSKCDDYDAARKEIRDGVHGMLPLEKMQEAETLIRRARE